MKIHFVIPTDKKIELSFKNLNEVHCIDNSISNSIFGKYNYAIDKIKRSEPNTNSFICFMHDDVEILDDNFFEKVEYTFNTYPNIGVLGVIGSLTIQESGGWWHSPLNHHIGRIVQGYDNGKKHEMIKRVGFTDKVVAVDGCFMICPLRLFNDIQFSDLYNSYHFYDLSLCVDALNHGYDVAIQDILIYHKSEGKGCLTKSWEDSKNIFYKYILDIGKTFPLSKKQFK